MMLPHFCGVPCCQPRWCGWQSWALPQTCRHEAEGTHPLKPVAERRSLPLPAVSSLWGLPGPPRLRDPSGGLFLGGPRSGPTPSSMTTAQLSTSTKTLAPNKVTFSGPGGQHDASFVVVVGDTQGENTQFNSQWLPWTSDIFFCQAVKSLFSSFPSRAQRIICPSPMGLSGNPFLGLSVVRRAAAGGSCPGSHGGP